MQFPRRIDTPIQPHEPTGIARSAAMLLASGASVHVRRITRRGS